MQSDSIDGFLVVDKPGGISSRDAVNRIQRLLPRRTKIGHTGTLDPLATGVLVFCVGRATKFADLVQAMGKTYRTRIRLGATSSTEDADGEINERVDVIKPDIQAICDFLPSFVGMISQLPPAFSALKVNGQRAYALARSGQVVVLQPRPVNVYRIELQAYEWPFLDLEIDCGKGTYIRSLARDLGDALGVGGYVQTLRRTRVGVFRVEDGVTVDVDRETVLSKLRPISDVQN